MYYILKDGRKVDLSRVVEVSEIRDEGLDTDTISESALSFSIRIKGSSSMKVPRNYHFADWGNEKLDLRKERSRLISAWQAYKKNKND